MSGGIGHLILYGPLLFAVPVAAAAGAVTFLSPCVLPLVPGYLSYVTGMSGVDAQAAGTGGAATGGTPAGGGSAPGPAAVAVTTVAPTTPATTSPGVNGSGGFTWYNPATISPSTKLTPAARTRISTSPGPGRGSGASSSTSCSGGPNPRHTIRRTLPPPQRHRYLRAVTGR